MASDAAAAAERLETDDPLVDAEALCFARIFATRSFTN